MLVKNKNKDVPTYGDDTFGLPPALFWYILDPKIDKYIASLPETAFNDVD